MSKIAKFLILNILVSLNALSIDYCNLYIKGIASSSSSVARIGHLGNHRNEVHKVFNKLFGDENWRISYSYKSKLITYEEALTLYENSYKRYLQDNPWILQLVTESAKDIYDTKISNIKSGTDYSIQEDDRNHLQDIAIRRVIKDLGESFKGNEYLQVRGKKSPLYILNPGQVPFIDPQTIALKKIFTAHWVLQGSIEDFWQNNKLIEVNKNLLYSKSTEETFKKLLLNGESKKTLIDTYSSIFFMFMINTKMNKETIRTFVQYLLKSNNKKDVIFNKMLITFKKNLITDEVLEDDLTNITYNMRFLFDELYAAGFVPESILLGPHSKLKAIMYRTIIRYNLFPNHYELHEQIEIDIDSAEKQTPSSYEKILNMPVASQSKRKEDYISKYSMRTNLEADIRQAHKSNIKGRENNSISILSTEKDGKKILDNIILNFPELKKHFNSPNGIDDNYILRNETIYEHTIDVINAFWGYYKGEKGDYGTRQHALINFALALHDLGKFATITKNTRQHAQTFKIINKQLKASGLTQDEIYYIKDLISSDILGRYMKRAIGELDFLRSLQNFAIKHAAIFKHPLAHLKVLKNFFYADIKQYPFLRGKLFVIDRVKIDETIDNYILKSISEGEENPQIRLVNKTDIITVKRIYKKGKGQIIITLTDKIRERFSKKFISVIISAADKEDVISRHLSNGQSMQIFARGKFSVSTSIKIDLSQIQEENELVEKLVYMLRSYRIDERFKIEHQLHKEIIKQANEEDLVIEYFEDLVLRLRLYTINEIMTTRKDYYQQLDLVRMKNYFDKISHLKDHNLNYYQRRFLNIYRPDIDIRSDDFNPLRSAYLRSRSTEAYDIMPTHSELPKTVIRYDINPYIKENYRGNTHSHINNVGLRPSKLFSTVTPLDHIEKNSVEIQNQSSFTSFSKVQKIEFSKRFLKENGGFLIILKLRELYNAIISGKLPYTTIITNSALTQRAKTMLEDALKQMDEIESAEDMAKDILYKLEEEFSYIEIDRGAAFNSFLRSLPFTPSKDLSKAINFASHIIESGEFLIQGPIPLEYLDVQRLKSQGPKR